MNEIIVDPSGPVVAKAAVIPPLHPSPESSGGGLGVLRLTLLLGVGRRRALTQTGEPRT